jgi:hypothetical protein
MFFPGTDDEEPILGIAKYQFFVIVPVYSGHPNPLPITNVILIYVHLSFSRKNNEVAP